MADNVSFQSSTLATPAASTSVATDDVGGVHYQRVKLDFGADGASSPLTAANPLPIVGTVQAHGTSQALGTYQPLAGSVHVASTVSILGTVQILAGSVHLASRLPGTADIGTVAGTVSILGTVQMLAGSVHVAATVQVLGTTQPLAGSVHLASGGSMQGYAAHDAAAVGAPVLSGAFGSSGTQDAVGNGDAVRLWADLNGRLWTNVQTFGGTVGGGTIQVHGTVQALGTYQPLAGSVHIAATVQALGTVQPLAGSAHLASRLPGTADIGTIAGTVSILGTVQALAGSVHVAATVQALGTYQPLAGSAHLATNLAGGSVVAVGSALHGAVADGRPILLGAFGSSGTQAAVDDGDAVRLWADLNGRLQIRGTIDSIPNVTITAGTVSLNTGGTAHVGSVQRIAGGTIDSFGGTVSGGTIRVLPPSGTALGETYFSTIYTAAANDATLIAAPGVGTFIRIYDILLSGSAAGTARILDSAAGTHIGHIHAAANGGWGFNSSRGVRTRTGNRAILFNCTVGTWGVLINYALETA